MRFRSVKGYGNRKDSWRFLALGPAAKQRFVGEHSQEKGEHSQEKWSIPKISLDTRDRRDEIPVRTFDRVKTSGNRGKPLCNAGQSPELTRNSSLVFHVISPTIPRASE